MTKVQKDKVIKDVKDNVLSDYLRLGWVKVDEKNNKPKENTFGSSTPTENTNK